MPTEMATTKTSPDTSPERGSLKFGMVLFDDTKNPTSGWAAVNGAGARRVDGFNQLPTDTLWWSNIDYNDFFSKTQANINPWLRHEAFLICKPKDVLMEWDLDPETTPSTFQAEILSTMFGRIMTMSYGLAKECNERLRMNTFFKSKTLSEDLAALLPKPEFPTGEAAAIMKAGQAFAHFTKTAVRGVRGARQFRLRRPRISYAVEMLTTPVPLGPFEFRSRSDLRNQGPDRVAWVRGTEEPCLVEVTVQQMEQSIAPVYGFGNSTDRDRRIPRSWVTHNEFLVMSSFSEIDVLSAFVGKNYSQMNLKLPDPLRRFLGDPNIETSWTAGIIAESLWRGACLGEEKRPGSAQGEERAQTSWRGAWIRASDKTSGFMSSMRLTDMGYAVASYGYGWIFCQVTEDQIPDLIRDGLSIGLLPNLKDVPPTLFSNPGPIPWGGDRKSSVLSKLTVTKEKQLLWNLDRLPLYKGEQRSVMLKKILEAHKAKRL